VDAARIGPGARVLVQGGAGGVGSLAVLYARHLGAEVWATASARNLDYLAQLGAEVIDYGSERFEDRVEELDAVVDCVGGETEARSFAVLRRGGRVVSVAGPDPDGELSLGKLARLGVSGSMRMARNLSRGHRYRFVSARVDRARLRALASLVDEGVLEVRLDRSFGLGELAAAHTYSETGRPRGKIVIDHAR
jgi:NADPH:quinone reductase-like Zn-dependent oxidoreductase